MKKKIALLLAVVLVFSLLAGCSSSSKAEDAAEPAVEEGQAEQTEQVTEQPDEPEQPVETEQPEEAETVQEEPEEVTNSVPVHSLPLTEEKKTLSIYSTAVNTPPTLSSMNVTTHDQLAAVEIAEERLNVHIDWLEVNFFTYLEQFNVYIAGGEYTDIILGANIYSGGWTAAYEDNVLIDLVPYLESCAPCYNYYMEERPSVYKTLLTDDGQLMAFYTLYDENISAKGLAINTEYYQQWGKDLPETYDEMRDYMLFAKDNMGCEMGFYMTSQCFDETLSRGYDVEPFEVGSATMPMYVEDGVVKCGLTADGYKQYLQTMNQWYNDGIINPEFVTTEWNPNDPSVDELLYAGDLSLYVGTVRGIGTQLEHVDLTPIPELNAEKGVYNHITPVTEIGDSCIAVSTQAEDPELCVKWMDYWFSEEGALLQNYGVEGINFNYVDGKPVYNDEGANVDYGVNMYTYMKVVTIAGIPYMESNVAASQTYSDEVLNILTVWNSRNSDNSNYYPDGASLSPLENEEASVLASDIGTFASEQVPQFILGELNFEDDWDAYVSTIQGLKIDRVIELYQAAYDRYATR